MASTGVLRLTCLRSISRTCAFPRLVTPASRTLQLESRRHAGTGGSAPGSGGPRRIKNLWVLGAGVGGIAVLAAMFGAYRAINDREKYIAQAKGTAKEGSTVDYQAVYNAVANVLEENAEEYDDGSYGPVLVRLAWHCSGTYDKNSGNGGSNGATMRFAPEANHGANAGLINGRNKLEPVKAQFPNISYSDLWTLAGVVGIQEMGGPKIPWRPGREDGLVENCTPDGRLPDGDKGADHIRQIFYRMGFTDQEIVALSGAHAIGRCHADRSGFDGPWTFSPVTFSNEYYRLLFDEKWTPKKWKGPFQFEDKSSRSLMMLATDMALVQDKAFRPIAEKYAKSQDAFFADFSKAFAKLIELGVPEKNFEGKEPLLLKSSDEVAAA